MVGSEGFARLVGEMEQRDRHEKIGALNDELDQQREQEKKLSLRLKRTGEDLIAFGNGLKIHASNDYMLTAPVTEAVKDWVNADRIRADLLGYRSARVRIVEIGKELALLRPQKPDDSATDKEEQQ